MYIHCIYIFNKAGCVFCFQLIIPQLLHALEPILGDQWTPDVEDTWSDFLKYITALMKQAMII